MAGHTGRQLVGFQFVQFLVDGITHLDDIRTSGCRDEQSQSTFAIVKELVARWVSIRLFDLGNVTQTQLVVVVPLNQHLADVFDGLEFITDCHTDALVAIVEIAGVGGLVLSVERGQYFSRLDTQVGHPILQERDVDALGPFAIDFDPIHLFHIVDLPLDQFGIVVQLPVTEAVTCQGIKYTIHIAEVIFDDGCTGSIG